MNETILKTINEVCDTYKDNPYILNRIGNYINNLPILLTNDLTNYEKRLNRTNELITEHDLFCKIFLSKHKYYYLSNNNCFYEYDDKTYKVIKEDDIHHNLLSTITEEGKLIQWKYKTKSHILKLIKERHLFKSIPETYTIQTILGFLKSTLFDSKIAAKYFLTVLGDNLLKKNSSCIYLVNQNTKKILSLLEEISVFTTGNSNIQNFITKYHESHNLMDYRIVRTTDNSLSYNIVKDMLNAIGVDLLCVAAHYSYRYQNAENLLNVILKEDIFKTHTLFLANNNQYQIIDGFIQQGLVIGTEEDTFSISWKNMHYIWKLYLNHLHIPNMIYSNQLKDILKTKLKYKEETDCFVHITSKYLPQISVFLEFWEKHIVIENGGFHEYELDELTQLFKSTQPYSSNINISEDEILKIIKHYFFPYVNILENRYIINIKCNLWNKTEDIECSLEYYKSTVVANNNSLISFDDLYNYYQTFICANSVVNKTTSNLVVSKHYFDKYITYSLHSCICFDKFIEFPL